METATQTATPKAKLKPPTQYPFLVNAGKNIIRQLPLHIMKMTVIAFTTPEGAANMPNVLRAMVEGLKASNSHMELRDGDKPEIATAPITGDELVEFFVNATAYAQASDDEREPYTPEQQAAVEAYEQQRATEEAMLAKLLFGKG